MLQPFCHWANSWGHWWNFWFPFGESPCLYNGKIIQSIFKRLWAPTGWTSPASVFLEVFGLGAGSGPDAHRWAHLAEISWAEVECFTHLFEPTEAVNKTVWIHKWLINGYIDLTRCHWLGSPKLPEVSFSRSWGHATDGGRPGSGVVSAVLIFVEDNANHGTLEIYGNITIDHQQYDNITGSLTVHKTTSEVCTGMGNEQRLPKDPPPTAPHWVVLMCIPLGHWMGTWC